jgi:hypothetical protein
MKQNDALLVLGGLAAAAVLVGGGIFAGGDTARKAAHGTDVTPGARGVWINDDLQPGLCQPSKMHNVLTRRHPLYRRPTEGRWHHRQLVEKGWQAWQYNPPSEETTA